MNDFNFKRKPDQPNSFFSMKESKETKVLTSSSKGAETTAFTDIDRDRYRMDINLKDDCFLRTQVGPSIDTDASVPASGGFHNYYRFIDDDKARKYNYGLHMLTPLIDMDVPVIPTIPKIDQNDTPLNTKHKFLMERVIFRTIGRSRHHHWTIQSRLLDRNTT